MRKYDIHFLPACNQLPVAVTCNQVIKNQEFFLFFSDGQMIAAFRGDQISGITSNKVGA